MLPSLIDYLLTLRRPSGGRLLYRDAVQITVEYFPPGFLLTHTISPPTGAYAYIGWATKLGTDMVPNTFTGFVQQFGTRAYTGVITSRVIEDSVDDLFWITDAEPLFIWIQNISPLAERLEVISHFLVCTGEDDYQQLLDALERLETSKKSETLAERTNELLSKIAGVST